MKTSGSKLKLLSYLKWVLASGLGLILIISLTGGEVFDQKEPTTRPEPVSLEFDSCTSIIVGRLASTDGSTMTSHSCDSNSDRTWINIVPRQKHQPGEKAEVYFEPKRLESFDDPNRLAVGEIPQVAETYAYFNAAYPFMNEWQLAAGETTIGGRPELKSDEGLLDAPELLRLMLERARTAREAIKIADELTRKYGYNDWGECLTLADPDEVWLFEIYGPGKGRKGAVWAAQRIPDEEIGVSANASRLRQLDLKNKDYFLASANVLSLAKEFGWWKEESGQPFEFCYAYAPESRYSLYCRRREWRVLSLLAPSLKLDPNAENYPFSVKPEKKVTVKNLLEIFRDTYEGTEYDLTASLLTVNRKNQVVKSPVANPFMSADWRELLRLKRERTICSPTATYLQITQSRKWLPPAIGGIVWLGYDNPATTPHLPFYAGIKNMPASYEIDGRGAYRRDCAWWAFRTVSKLVTFRYQEMKEEAAQIWKQLEDKAFEQQAAIEAEALKLYQEDPEKAREFLTSYCQQQAGQAVADYWQLAGQLWVKYSANF